MEISKISKLISCVLAMCLCFAVTPVFAQQQYVEVGSSAQTDVYLNVEDGDVTVSVPTTIILDGTSDENGKHVGEYSVWAAGDISGNTYLNVYPISSEVELTSQGKSSVTAAITQEKIQFDSSELLGGGGTDFR